MSKELNIAEILKGKPQGTKLYTPISGDVWLVKAEGNEFAGSYPISVSRSEEGAVKALDMLAFTAQGHYMNTGECLLFPSNNMRDWEKFTWERGDVLMDNYGIWCMFDGWTTDDFIQFYSNYSVTIDPSNEQTFYEDKVFSTKEFHKVGANAAKDFIASLEKKYGGRFNPGTLKIEKSRPKFKDGDVVYIETDKYKIVAIFIKFSKQKKPLVYVEYFLGNTSAILADKFDGYNILCDKEEIREMRLATEEEKELLFSKLEEIGKKWDSENLKIVDLHKKYEFKPFDKVLVRDVDEEIWLPAFYSSFDDTNKTYPYNVMSQGCSMWKQCIPYEGNEELLGTSNKPKEGGEE